LQTIRIQWSNYQPIFGKRYIKSDQILIGV
jgi:hypothetical protein